MRVFAESETTVTLSTPAGRVVQRLPQGMWHAGEPGSSSTVCGLPTSTLVEYGAYISFSSLPGNHRCTRCQEVVRRDRLA